MLHDFSSRYGLIIGIVGLVCGLLYTFLYKDRYKTLVNDIYIPGNDELRKQRDEAYEENKELDKQNAALQAALDEKEASSRQIQKLVSKLPDFTNLTQQLAEISRQGNANHTQVMKQLVDLTKLIAGGKNGKQ